MFFENMHDIHTKNKTKKLKLVKKKSPDTSERFENMQELMYKNTDNEAHTSRNIMLGRAVSNKFKFHPKRYAKK